MVIIDPNTNLPFEKNEITAVSESAFSGGSFSGGKMFHDGEKYAGGLDPVSLVSTDYWTLRERSSNFFKNNLYGRGIIRRLVTNVINTGLSLDAEPIVGLIPLSEEQSASWTESVEDSFQSWSSLPKICDWKKQDTFGEIEKNAYREALIEGDVLVIEHYNSSTQLPCYELVSGGLVQTPITKQTLAKGNTIEHGVELNFRRQHVAYWVVQSDMTYKRIKARGRNGDVISWLYYATDKRASETRGEPLLSLIMQSISEIDKYRDSTQRKASVNSLLAMFFYQSTDSKTPNSRPVSAGATRRGSTSEVVEETGFNLNMAEHHPGLVYENLPPGVKPEGFSNKGTDEKFGDFEDSILSGIAWALEIPKSVLKMEFSNSYSASRGEVKEFNMFLGAARNRYADTFLRPVYTSWLLAMVLTRRISAPGLLEAWRDPMKFEVFGAWINSNWYGAVKEAVDMLKEVNGLSKMAENGYTTNAVATRQLTNTRFTTNIKRIQRENELKAASMRPILELEKEFGADNVNALSNQINSANNDYIKIE